MLNYVYQLISPQSFSVKYEDIDLNSRVIVRPRYMAICHADQRYYRGLRDINVLRKKLPMALIHECCGEVIIDKTGTFSPGQTVVMIPNQPADLDGKDENYYFENYRSDSKFLSSGYDGFMREFVDIHPDRAVAFDNIPLPIAAITEFVSVACHSFSRFMSCSHSKRDTIAIWGDGSLAFVMADVIKANLPSSKIVVIGKTPEKMHRFTFVDRIISADRIPAGFTFDHGFECVGGEGSFYAINDMIDHANPQASFVLMGVSENNVPINTRMVLEKGLTLIGSSRSGRVDFENAVALMQKNRIKKQLSTIIYEDQPVKSFGDIHRVFATDSQTPFKTVFEWRL